MEKKSNAIEKALMILTLFIPYNEEMRSIEISEKLGFHKATVSRTLQILTRKGFLIQNPRTKKFSLGRTILDLSGAMNHSLQSRIIDIARPFVKELRERLQESVIFTVLTGEYAVMAYIVQGPRLIPHAVRIGDHDPFHASAGGKVLLAFLSEEIKDQLLKKKLHRFTPNTITDKKKLLHLLEEIRKNGVAFDHGEFFKDNSAVGAPILDHEGKPVAALTVVCPSKKHILDLNSSIVKDIKKTAADISAQLHYKE